MKDVEIAPLYFSETSVPVSLTTMNIPVSSNGHAHRRDSLKSRDNEKVKLSLSTARGPIGGTEE